MLGNFKRFRPKHGGPSNYPTPMFSGNDLPLLDRGVIGKELEEAGENGYRMIAAMAKTIVVIIITVRPIFVFNQMVLYSKMRLFCSPLTVFKHIVQQLSI